MIKLTDFQKIQCPFIREEFKVDRDWWMVYGSQYQLRRPEVYLAMDLVNPGYEWVFDDKSTQAIEKLDGTNVKLFTKDGRLESVYNRKNPIDILDISGSKGRTAIVEAIFMAIAKGYVKYDGEQAGEVIGRHLQGNPYKLAGHIWYPFEKANKELSYDSWHKHERTYANLSLWFKDYLISRFYAKRTPVGVTDNILAEGVVFYNETRRKLGQIYMAKLRRDMFKWYYDGIQIIE
jgi:hypothetical protein